MEKEIYIKNLLILKDIIKEESTTSKLRERARKAKGVVDFVADWMLPFGCTISNLKDMIHLDTSSIGRFWYAAKAGGWAVVETITSFLNPLYRQKGGFAVALKGQGILQIASITLACLTTGDGANDFWLDIDKIIKYYKTKVIRSTQEDIDAAKKAINLDQLKKSTEQLKKLSKTIPATNEYKVQARKMASKAYADIKKAWIFSGVALIICTLILLMIFGLAGGSNTNILQHIKDRDFKGLVNDFSKIGIFTILTFQAILGVAFIITALYDFSKEKSVFVKMVDAIGVNVQYVQKFYLSLIDLVNKIVNTTM